MTKKYSLSQLIASTTDIELKHPLSGEPTGITVTVMAADSPKVATAIALALGSMPPYPKDDSTYADLASFNNADRLANRDIVIARVVSSNDEGLSTPEQRKSFFADCDYAIIEQIQTEGADRNLYFR